MYSQGIEEKVIGNYFKGIVGKCLSIGENDGKTFSNVLALIEQGWTAILVEPSPTAFEKMCDLHKDRDNVYCYNVAIGETDGWGVLLDMGEHIGKGDTSLLSTLVRSETDRWAGTEFVETPCFVQTYAEFIKDKPFQNFDMISIDAEGLDLAILTQIDLSKTKLVVVEWNGKRFQEFEQYFNVFGFQLIHKNAENLIWAIPHSR